MEGFVSFSKRPSFKREESAFRSFETLVSSLTGSGFLKVSWSLRFRGAFGSSP